MDTCGYLHMNNPTSRQLIKTWMATNNLADVWRERNPEKKEFMFDKHQSRNRTKARLDYFLVSKNTIELIMDINIGRA